MTGRRRQNALPWDALSVAATNSLLLAIIGKHGLRALVVPLTAPNNGGGSDAEPSFLPPVFKILHLSRIIPHSQVS
jgi:hypothetical protein